MTAIAILLFAAAGGELKDEFYQDFRGGKPIHPVMRIFGPDLDRVMAHEPMGLHIRVAADRKQFGPVGVSPKFHISGDFEITATFQLLSADPGYFSAGVNLRVISGHPMRIAADFARYNWSGEGGVFFTHVVRIKEAALEKPEKDRTEEDREHDVSLFATTAGYGRLRLKREGSTLHYLVAEEDEETFRELVQKEFTADDCIVRFVCYTGPKRGADVRLVDLRIRAEKLPVTTAPPRRLGPLAWGVIIVACALALTLLGLLIHHVWQKAASAPARASKSPASKGPPQRAAGVRQRGQGRQ